MKIVNSITEDYHMHTSTFSDAIPTINELVIYAGKIGMTEIGVTDHSELCLKALNINPRHRSLANRWRNVHNNVNVIFGIEGDILDDEGNMCDHIHGYKSDLLIASLHPQTYKGTNPTKAYIEAMKKNKISFIGHPCAKYFGKQVEIREITKAANDFNLPLEIDCANLMNNNTVISKLEKMLTLADQIIINSDAHVLNELKEARKLGYLFLQDRGYLNP